MSVLQISKNLEENPPAFSVEFTNTIKDFEEWFKFAFHKNINNQKRNILIIVLLYFLFICLIFYLMYNQLLVSILLSLFSSFLLYLVFTYVLIWRSARSTQKIPDLFLTLRINFLENSVLFKTTISQSTRNYKDFKKMYETENYLFLMINDLQAFVFPKKYFRVEQIEFIKSKISISRA